VVVLWQMHIEGGWLFPWRLLSATLLEFKDDFFVVLEKDQAVTTNLISKDMNAENDIP
jgi:hypothetical protein